MKQEDLLVLLVVFVLGFVVSQMMSGRLVEGEEVVCTNDDDCKQFSCRHEQDTFHDILCWADDNRCYVGYCPSLTGWTSEEPRTCRCGQKGWNNDR